MLYVGGSKDHPTSSMSLPTRRSHMEDNRRRTCAGAQRHSTVGSFTHAQNLGERLEQQTEFKLPKQATGPTPDQSSYGSDDRQQQCPTFPKHPGKWWTNHLPVKPLRYRDRETIGLYLYVSMSDTHIYHPPLTIYRSLCHGCRCGKREGCAQP